MLPSPLPPRWVRDYRMRLPADGRARIAEVIHHEVRHRLYPVVPHVYRHRAVHHARLIRPPRVDVALPIERADRGPQLAQYAHASRREHHLGPPSNGIGLQKRFHYLDAVRDRHLLPSEYQSLPDPPRLRRRYRRPLAICPRYVHDSETNVPAPRPRYRVVHYVDNVVRDLVELVHLIESPHLPVYHLHRFHSVGVLRPGINRKVYRLPRHPLQISLDVQVHAKIPPEYRPLRRTRQRSAFLHERLTAHALL